MIKINANVKRYFDNLSKVTRFYFTSDGLAFFNQDLAKVHAANLKKNKKSDQVTLITRDEVNAWAATIATVAPSGSTPAQDTKADTEGQLAAAKAGLADAEAALTAAEAAQNTINANTAATPAQKATATKVLNKATVDVATATAAVATAQGVVDGLTKGTN